MLAPGCGLALALPMPRRLTRVLLAFMIAVTATLPASVRAMPMPADMSGAAMPQHCPSCPTGTTPDQMPACQILACAGAVATLPTPVLLPGRALLRVVYLAAPAVRWIGMPPVPDPFPPRPIALI
jgi:hypothetical protein